VSTMTILYTMVMVLTLLYDPIAQNVMRPKHISSVTVTHSKTNLSNVQIGAYSHLFAMMDSGTDVVLLTAVEGDQSRILQGIKEIVVNEASNRI
jgi:hypothetical protein